ncbi:MAG: SARP family transcriptional regulator, partial [Chloroflexi bacterium]|nr:SARP family transcriptional regulator [Chloroflexota bacterium]
MAELKLFTFGPPRLERDGHPIDLNLRKALALLIYLTVTAQPQSRDTLATLLWPNSDQREARGRLRRTLHRLRDELGVDIVGVTNDTIHLHQTAQLWFDGTKFLHHAARGLAAHGAGDADQIEQLRVAEALYTDDFLAGWTVAESAAFDEW